MSCSCLPHNTKQSQPEARGQVAWTVRFTYCTLPDLRGTVKLLRKVFGDSIDRVLPWGEKTKVWARPGHKTLLPT